MRVGILGPVELLIDDAIRPVATSKERAVLAALALRAGTPVSPATLCDAIWGDEPPPTATRTLGTHVSRLRGIIGSDRLERSPTGYILDVDPRDVDVHQLASLLQKARTALDADTPSEARIAARAARDLWRGEPLLDLADGILRRGEIVRLEELRHEGTELRVRADLALGHHRELIGELEALVEADPLGEEMWGHLMVALYRGGRQADALRAFARLRRLLVDELGLEPSPPLVRLERLILEQDPQLDLTPPPPPDNLPAPSSSFIGRERELDEVGRDIAEHRIVTLVGPGGVGKTRLALAAAHDAAGDFSDGIVWVDLASVRDPASIVPALADALGVVPAIGTSLHDAVVASLRGREILLLLDNCEHLLDNVVPLVAQFVEAAPMLAVLATSRERLGLPSEHPYAVAPLPVGDATERPDAPLPDAACLLLERVTARDEPWSHPDPVLLAEICRHLDGIPLAIELVATRATFSTPAELGEQLSRRVGPLTERHGLPDPRYDSLREAFEWSRELLTEDENELLDRLTVAPSTFDKTLVTALGHDLPAGQELDEAFGHLVDASLVQPAPTADGARRYHLLETIREYAASRISTETAADMLQRHADHYRTMAIRLRDALPGPEMSNAVANVLLDDANLRAAAAWTHENDQSHTLDFAPVGYAWFVHGDLEGSQALLEPLLAHADNADPARRADALHILAWTMLLSGDGIQAWTLLDEARRLALEAGDSRRAAAVDAARGHTMLLGVGDPEGALPFYDDALDNCTADDAPHEWSLARLGKAQALVLGDRPEGVGDALAQVADHLRQADDPNHHAHLCLDLALLHWCQGELDSIVPTAEEGIRQARRAKNSSWHQINLVALGVGWLVTRHPDAAEAPLLRAARMALDDANVLQLGIVLQCLAALEADSGRAIEAARIFGAGCAFAPLWPLLRRGLGPYLDPARRQLGSRFDVERAAGAAMTPADAVADALQSHA